MSPAQDKKERCQKCKKLLPINFFSKNKNKPNGLQTWCRPCVNKYDYDYVRQQKSNPEFVQVPQPWYLKQIKYHAQKRESCQVKLTYQELLDANHCQKCCFCGTQLKFTRTLKQAPGNQNASLDRIDSDKGYIKGNIQWTCWNCNHHKNNTDNEDFIQMCRNIYWYNPGPSTINNLFE